MLTFVASKMVPIVEASHRRVVETHAAVSTERLTVQFVLLTLVWFVCRGRKAENRN
jgi:hypothetical protein